MTGAQSDSKDQQRIHDFRTENWFIQASSSPKDIVRHTFISLTIKMRQMEMITKVEIFRHERI